MSSIVAVASMQTRIMTENVMHLTHVEIALLPINSL